MRLFSQCVSSNSYPLKTSGTLRSRLSQYDVKELPIKLGLNAGRNKVKVGARTIWLGRPRT